MLGIPTFSTRFALNLSEPFIPFPNFTLGRSDLWAVAKTKAAIHAPLGICEKHKDKVLRDGCSSKTILDLVTKLKTRLSFSDHKTCGRHEMFPRRAVFGCSFPFESFR